MADSQTTVCRWCRGAKMVPQMDAGDVPCPVCKGSGEQSQTTAEAAEQAVIKAALKFDDVMTEMEGELRYCEEPLDALFAAIARLRVIRNLETT